MKKRFTINPTVPSFALMFIFFTSMIATKDNWYLVMVGIQGIAILGIAYIGFFKKELTTEAEKALDKK